MSQAFRHAFLRLTDTYLALLALLLALAGLDTPPLFVWVRIPPRVSSGVPCADPARAGFLGLLLRLLLIVFLGVFLVLLSLLLVLLAVGCSPAAGAVSTVPVIASAAIVTTAAAASAVVTAVTVPSAGAVTVLLVAVLVIRTGPLGLLRLLVRLLLLLVGRLPADAVRDREIHRRMFVRAFYQITPAGLGTALCGIGWEARLAGREVNRGQLAGLGVVRGTVQQRFVVGWWRTAVRRRRIEESHLRVATCQVLSRRSPSIPQRGRMPSFFPRPWLTPS